MSEVTVPTIASWPLRSAHTAWLLATASMLLVAAAVAMSLAWSFEAPFAPYAVLIATLHPAVGAVVATKQPRNAVGWLLIAIGLAEGASALSATWATLALDVSPGAVPAGVVAAWFADWLWMPAYALAVTFLPLLFPDGRLPSRRWLPVAGGSGAPRDRAGARCHTTDVVQPDGVLRAVGFAATGAPRPPVGSRERRSRQAKELLRCGHGSITFGPSRAHGPK
jgi:hypothetical protein